MSKEFIIAGGKVVLGKDLKVFNNSDNIEEIIQCQDTIESLKLKIEKIESKKKACERDNKHKIKAHIMEIIMALIAVGISICGFQMLFFSEGNLHQLGLVGKSFFSSMFVSLPIFATYLPISNIILGKKELNALNVQLDYLKEELEKQKQKENYLNNNNKKYSLEKESEYDNKIIQLNNKDKVVIDDMSKLFYNISLKQKKYKRLLKNGKLEEMIKNIYKNSDNSDEIVNEQLEHSKKILLKKK